MSRYLGPIYKKSRRLNFSILENQEEFKNQKNKVFKKNTRRKRKTDFAFQLEEKQKLRFRYHLSEKPLKNLIKKTWKMKGIKGDNILLNLEKRLDNVVFRIGFANTRKKARQMVNHGHILVNNRKIDIPSYILKVNDLITLKKPKTKKNSQVIESFEHRKIFSFLEVDLKNFAGKLIAVPDLKELAIDVNISLVIEYYNRFI